MMPTAAQSPRQEVVAIEGNIPRKSETHELSSKVWMTALVLGVAALALFLWRITVPDHPFYDEIQYVAAARAFLAHSGNPNPEAPPLGKLLLALGIKLFGDHPLGWRIMGAAFGSLTLVGVFLWAQLLLRDYALSLTAALLTLFNNFLYVMSRVAMMDVFLVALLIWGLVAFTAVLEVDSLSVTKRRGLLAFAGVLFGLACACKWNGVDTFGIVILISAGLWLFATRSQNEEIARYARNLRQAGMVPASSSLLVIPVVAYSLTFWILCRSIHVPFGLKQLADMNAFIWRFHKTVPGNPAIAVPWYSWPFQVGPQRALSYLVGNWVIMWAGLLAVGFCLLRVRNRLPEMLVVALYAGNLLQWALTPQRLLYYYYYFPAAMFLGIAIPVALRGMPARVFGVRLGVVCAVAAGCAFIYCFPHMAHMDAPFDCMLGCWP